MTCCTGGDCCGPGSYCCANTGPHEHPELEEEMTPDDTTRAALAARITETLADVNHPRPIVRPSTLDLVALLQEARSLLAQTEAQPPVGSKVPIEPNAQNSSQPPTEPEHTRGVYGGSVAQPPTEPTDAEVEAGAKAMRDWVAANPDDIRFIGMGDRWLTRSILAAAHRTQEGRE